MLFSLIGILQLMTQELLALPEHPCSSPVFSEVRIAHSIFSFLCSVLYSTACPIALLFLSFDIVFFFELRLLITPLLSSNLSYLYLRQEQYILLTLPEHLSSPPVFSRVRVTKSFVLYVCFIDRCLSFCTFSFGHCVVFFFDILILITPLCYLQT